MLAASPAVSTQVSRVIRPFPESSIDERNRFWNSICRLTIGGRSTEPSASKTLMPRAAKASSNALTDPTPGEKHAPIPLRSSGTRYPPSPPAPMRIKSIPGLAGRSCWMSFRTSSGPASLLGRYPVCIIALFKNLFTGVDPVSWEVQTLNPLRKCVNARTEEWSLAWTPLASFCTSMHSLGSPRVPCRHTC